MREVFHLAYPVVITQLSATAMGIVDAAMVGRLGATQLAAVGFGGVWCLRLRLQFVSAHQAVAHVHYVIEGDAQKLSGRCVWLVCLLSHRV